MKTIIFAFPGNDKISSRITSLLNAEIGELEIRRFPDEETYVRVMSEVTGKRVVLVCTLARPDEKLLPLYFISRTVKVLGAKHISLMAPYLAYMRQDKRFKEGEGVTSTYFASMVSNFVDSLTTVDPHLHRRSSLEEIYTVPTTVVHAADHISRWIKGNVSNPVLVGPDEESEQWVSEVAKNANAPFIILEKIRLGDRNVEISIPKIKDYVDCTPVLVDDIISTARTMIETVHHLNKAGMKPAVCIGVHAVFSGDAYQDLLDAGVSSVVTCNTIAHESNAIDVSDLIVSQSMKLWQGELKP